MNYVTQEYLIDKIKEAKLEVIKAEAEGYHKDYPNTQAERLLNRLLKLKVFVDAGFNRITIEGHQGFVIKRKFVIAWKQKKWRVVNHSTWYKYDEPADFWERFD